MARTEGTRTVDGFCWLDLKTRDPEGVAGFFGTELGWRFAVDEEDWRRATKISTGGYAIGGVSDLSNPVYPPGTPPHIAYYLATDDTDRRAEAATGAGARLVVPPFDAADQGRMATLIDPWGAAVSLWQAREFGGWAFPPGTPGTPVRACHTSGDPEGAHRFYGEVLGVPSLPRDRFVAAGPGEDPGWRLIIGMGTDPEAGTAPEPEPAAVLRAPDGTAFTVARSRPRPGGGPGAGPGR
ncbi:VOC family protein [Streptomyces sp. NPDC000594]|uniref:VOC family protein n=1 Tax=Streptomyces sp. NPDC000594 TaxID=3154261 RepID=UPI0033293777